MVFRLERGRWWAFLLEFGCHLGDMGTNMLTSGWQGWAALFYLWEDLGPLPNHGWSLPAQPPSALGFGRAGELGDCICIRPGNAPTVRVER